MYITKIFPPYSFYEEFHSSIFIFRSVKYFKLVKVFKFLFFVYGYLIVVEHFVENIIFPGLICLVPLWKIN